MSNNFSFGKISSSSKKQTLNVKLEDTVVLIDKSNAYATYDFIPVVLCDEIYEKLPLEGIDNFLKKAGLTKYIALSAINCGIDERYIKKEGKIKFYKFYKSEFEKYIPKGAPIITVGSGLYSLLMEDDIFPSHVQQIIWGKTDFWFSKDLTTENCHRIYPIESFRSIFANGFKKEVDSYKTKLAQVQINNCIINGGKPIPRYPKLNKIFIETKEQFLNEFYEPNKNRHDYVAWDTETSGLNFVKDELGCVTISFGENTGYYIPWRIMDEECKTKLNEIFKNNTQITANGKFDIKFLWSRGVPDARVDEDVLLLGHSLDETRSNSLKSLSYFYSLYGGYERELDKIKSHFKRREINYLRDIPEEVLRDYAVMDAIVTYKIYFEMIEHVRELDKRYPNELYPENTLEHFYRHNRLAADYVYAGCEYRGIPVDKEMLDDVRKRLIAYMDELHTQLSEAFNVPKDFQWGSSKQLGELLERKGWECLGRAKSGEYLVGKFQLKRWVKEHKEAKLLQELGSMETLLGTFVGEDTKNSIIADFLGTNDEESSIGWTKCLNYWGEEKGYGFNPSFASMKADSNRSRCTSPNMQQVPTRGKFAEDIKRCIKSPDDEKYYIVTCDFSSLQLRLANYDSSTQDALKEALKNPYVDLHSMTSYNTFFKDKEVDVDIITVTQNGKTKEYLGGQLVLTKRGEVPASELVKDDEIIDF